MEYMHWLAKIKLKIINEKLNISFFHPFIFVACAVIITPPKNCYFPTMFDVLPPLENRIRKTLNCDFSPDKKKKYFK